MSTVSVSGKEELSNLMSSGGTFMLCFSATSWCVPCQRLAPHYEAAAAAVPEITWVEISLDDPDNDLVAKFFDVWSVPKILSVTPDGGVQDVEQRTAPQLIAHAKTLI